MIAGKWQGYFIDNRALHGKASGSKWLIDVTMNFENNNEFTATGNDDVGPFTFKKGQIKGGRERKHILTFIRCANSFLDGILCVEPRFALIATDLSEFAKCSNENYIILLEH